MGTSSLDKEYLPCKETGTWVPIPHHLTGMIPPINSKTLFPEPPIARKLMPVCTGVLDYFPLALKEVSKCSKAGNDQHNLGQELHWDKTKSTDHADSLVRHLLDRGTFDTDGVRHSAKVAWRALALLETEIEKENGK